MLQVNCAAMSQDDWPGAVLLRRFRGSTTGADGGRASLPRAPVGRDHRLQSPWHSVIAPPLAGMPADAGDQLDRAGATRARELSAEAAKLVPGAESRVEQQHGPIWQTILETADSMDAAVIVVGSRGLSGLRSSLLGSVSHALVNRARRPVLVFPPDDPD